MSFVKSRKHAAPTYPAASPLAAALFTSLVMASPAAFADEAVATPDGSRATTTLDEVEVHGEKVMSYTGERTSPKFDKPLVDTTRTVQVIGEDLFDEQAATTLSEALRNAAGVGTFYAGENGNTTTGDAVFMRGFDASSSIFVDGVRDLGSISRDVFNLQQVEVVKGAAGADYGRSTPSGAINLVSKQAHDRDELSGSLTLGDFSRRRATLDWNEALDESRAFRLNLMVQDSDVPGRDYVEQDRWGVAPSFTFGLGSATVVNVNLLHVEQNNVPDGGVPTIGLPGYASPDPARPEIGQAPRVDSSNFYGTRADHDDVESDMFTVRVSHAFSGGASLVNTSRWGRTRQDYLLTAFMLSSDPARFITPDIDDPSTWEVARSLPTFKDQRNEILANQTNLSLQVDTAGGIRHDLDLGLELTREELRTRGQAAVGGSAWPYANLYRPNPDVTGLVWAHDGTGGEGRTDTIALYAFDTIHLNEQWQLNGGLRVDRYSTDFSNLVACGSRNAPACGDLPAGTPVPGVDASLSDTLLSWNVGALYKPTANSSLYANYAIAYQPPGGGQLELSDRPNNANNPAFDPQESRTAELGGKWELGEGRLLLTAALYETRVLNEIVQDPIDQQYYQTGEKRVRGIELGAVGSITERWSVSAGYTLMDTEVVEGSSVTADGSSVLAYTPRHAFTGWTTYSFGNGLVIGGGARHTGKLTRGSDGAIGTPTHVDGYWVADLVASYEFQNGVELQLNLNNIFDEDYVAAINKSGYRYVPGAPRNVLLTVGYRF